MYTTTLDYPGGPTVTLVSCSDNDTPAPVIIAGHDATSGTFSGDGEISAGYDIGPITVGGSLIGDATNPVLIVASGQFEPPATIKDLAGLPRVIRARRI